MLCVVFSEHFQLTLDESNNPGYFKTKTKFSLVLRNLDRNLEEKNRLIVKKYNPVFYYSKVQGVRIFKSAPPPDHHTAVLTEFRQNPSPPPSPQRVLKCITWGSMGSGPWLAPPSPLPLPLEIDKLYQNRKRYIFFI